MGLFCDECKRNIATVFLTKISGTEVSEVHLCEECAKRMEEESGMVAFLNFLPQILAGLQEIQGIPAIDAEAAESVFPAQIVTCEKCNTTFSDFEKLGFLGCAHCYESFGEPLMEMIEGLQGSLEHKGKIPKNASAEAKLRRKLLELESNLEKRVAREEYEAAATVRDQIKRLKRKLVDSREKQSEEERG